ncbi:MAG: NTP transferase domain-containing protein [Chitinophagaceae bacterium]|nr:NTP transferase domain-containing protein [Chitinophagaceae bacterium]
MKAIIPVAGAGTKLRPHTYTQPKALIPLAGKTLLSIIVDQLADAGIKEFVFIIGYLGDKIQDYVKQHYPHLQCYFVLQNERHGLGHAIYLTKDIVGNDEIFIVLGDTICEYNVPEMLYSRDSMLGVKKVDDPRNFGVAEIGEDGLISKVVEKPQIPKSNQALVGLYKIKDATFLFACLEEMINGEQKNRNEYSLTDALECMIKKGVVFRPFKVQNWFDCGRINSLLESNATLMKKFGGKISQEHVFENVIIVPPVSIGRGCEINNSIIGPNVAIGEEARITYSIVRDSIIGDFANLYDVVLHDSLIGSDTEIKGETRSLNIGDNTQIDLG